MMPKRFPRSPYERLGGYVHLARLIDKARMHRQGLLKGYNYKTVGFDKHLLAFLELDPDVFEQLANELDDATLLQWISENATPHSDEEREQWNQAMIARSPDSAEKKVRFYHFLTEAGGEGRNDIQTYFDLIELDEGRKQ